MGSDVASSSQLRKKRASYARDKVTLCDGRQSHLFEKQLDPLETPKEKEQSSSEVWEEVETQETVNQLHPRGLFAISRP